MPQIECPNCGNDSFQWNSMVPSTQLVSFRALHGVAEVDVWGGRDVYYESEESTDDPVECLGCGWTGTAEELCIVVDDEEEDDEEEDDQEYHLFVGSSDDNVVLED